VGDYIPTPRYGKPVEINALWYNALKIMEEFALELNEDFEQGLSQKVKASFKKFYNVEGLFDVLEPNSEQIRPNQIFAIGLDFSPIEDEKAREKKIVEIEKMLRLRLGEHKGDPNFKKFADKLDELRERMAQSLISSIDFLKQLLALAKDMLEEEKKTNEPQDKRAQARAALTDLFQSIKTDETPIIVEQVVNDIDTEVVNIVRQFNDAFQTVTAQREIKKKLRSILWVKYQIKDNDVFEKAYQYIEMYY
jgi:hypothetical protein